MVSIVFPIRERHQIVFIVYVIWLINFLSTLVITYIIKILQGQHFFC